MEPEEVAEVDVRFSLIESYVPTATKLARIMEDAHGFPVLEEVEIYDLASRLYTVDSTYSFAKHATLKPSAKLSKLQNLDSAATLLVALSRKDTLHFSAAHQALRLSWENAGDDKPEIDFDVWLSHALRLQSAIGLAMVMNGVITEDEGLSMSESLSYVFDAQIAYKHQVGPLTWLKGDGLPGIFHSIYPDQRVGQNSDLEVRSGPLFTFVTSAFELIEGVVLTGIDREKFADSIMTARVRTGRTKKLQPKK